VTRSQLAAALHALGVTPGGVLMVHTRMSALGWVVGGSETVVRALLDALGPDGTLMAYVPWDDHVYREEERRSHHDEYRAEPPRFDPATAEADRENGRIPERIRTWPGAVHSGHPDAGVAAVGARAEWLAGGGHRDNDAFGRDSPFARLVEAGGQVLMLGAPLDTVTLLHHAEALAHSGRKRMVSYEVPFADGTTRSYTDIDTGLGTFPYEELQLKADEFLTLASAALTAGIGKAGPAGPAPCHLFPARELTAFAVDWLERRFN
jgi:aminoglycoside 3-N-acetyltransferase